MTGIRLKNIQKSYQVEDRTVPVLNGIDLDIPAGTITVILGQSGCGKTTLLRLTGGLEEADGGEILWDGNHKTAFVFQEPRLMPWLNVWDNVVFGVKKNRQDPEMIRKLIHTVGLSGFEKAFPSQLSGGMKQRCAIAQAFSMDPPILLMDEPFGALDAVTRSRLQDLVLKLWAQDNPKKTVFFVTHDVDEAILLANRIIVLGQSPSSIIYECVIPEDGRPTREIQFENPELLRLRTKLIRQINKDVTDHIE